MLILRKEEEEWRGGGKLLVYKKFQFNIPNTITAEIFNDIHPTFRIQMHVLVPVRATHEDLCL